MPIVDHTHTTQHKLEKRMSSFSQKVTRPKTMLKLVGMMSMLVIGMGVMAATMQQSQNSTDSRSQASSQTIRNIYFGDTTLFDVSAPVTVPINIDAAREMSAVSFALDYDTDEVSTVSFSPTNSEKFDTRQEIISLNGEGGVRSFFMITPHDPMTTSFIPRNVGNLTIQFDEEFVARTYVTTNVSFAPNNVATKLPNQAVPVDSSTEIFALTPGSPLAMRTGGDGPTPTVNPAITFPGVSSLGQFWYCPASACEDGGTTVPQWVSMPLTPGQTTVEVPATAQLLRYNVSGVAPSSPWTTVMKAHSSNQSTEITGNAAPLVVGDATHPLTQSSWPVTLWANFRQTAGSNPVNVYTCTTQPDTSPGKKKYLFYQLGRPESSVPIANGCQNETRIIVQKAGTTPTITPTPTVTLSVSATPTLTPTLAPSVSPSATPTPISTALSCPIAGPVPIAPSIMRVVEGDQTRYILKWSNVLAGSTGRYGVYLVNAAGASPYYLFDAKDQNVDFTTWENGFLQDTTLSLLPGTQSTMTWTWTVPMGDDVLDKTGTKVKDRTSYRFLVYARLNDGTKVCSNQAVIGSYNR